LDDDEDFISSLSLYHLAVGCGLAVNGILIVMFSSFSNITVLLYRSGNLILGAALKN